MNTNSDASAVLQLSTYKLGFIFYASPSFQNFVTDDNFFWLFVGVFLIEIERIEIRKPKWQIHAKNILLNLNAIEILAEVISHHNRNMAMAYRVRMRWTIEQNGHEKLRENRLTKTNEQCTSAH